MDTDGPQFLTTAPVAPVAPAAVEHARVVRPQPPRKLARLRKPHNAPFRDPERVEEEPDALARYLGPGRMPRLIIRYPRACGAALFAFGVYMATHLVTYTVSGDTMIEWHSRSGPILTTIGIFVGGFWMIAGRPSDSRGYSPGWWNRMYIAVCIVAGIAALVVGHT